MTDWLMVSILLSIRCAVAKDVKKHLRSNATILSARPPTGVKILHKIYGQRGLLGFLVPYTALVGLLTLSETTVSTHWPHLIPIWSNAQTIAPFLKDVTSYFLGAQVVMVGLVFPIAVGLVTLIVQRESSSSTVSDIQMYYGESLAYRIGASGIALSIVLATQLLWPIQVAVYAFGYGTPANTAKVGLTAIHLVWLVINLVALWHFLQTSLSFMRPAERALLRRRFAAHVSIPDDLSERLTWARYANAEHFLLDQPGTCLMEDGKPTILLGSSLDEYGKIEVAAPATSKKILKDVWLRSLRWAVRSWLNRCSKQAADAPRGLSGPTLVFLPNWRRPMPDDGIICRRNHGVPLNAMERFLIKQSFRFRNQRR